MKKVFLVISLILLLVVSGGCALDAPAATVAQPFATVASVDQKDAAITALITKESADRANGDAALTKRVDDVSAKVGTSTNSYTKTEVDAMKADLQSKIDALTTKVNQWTNPTPGQPSSPPTGTPTGVVSYTIQNPLQYYQFQSGSQNIIVLRIFNNTAQSQKIRPQVTISTYQGQNAGAATATCVVSSNSQGQTNINFTANAFPVGAVTSVVFFAGGGGFDSAGNYLLGSGTQMDLYLTVTVTGGNAVLWTINVTGTNNPL